jgi:hypothetical protein
VKSNCFAKLVPEILSPVIFGVVCVGGILALSGCMGSKGDFVPVEGTVTWKKQPLDHGVITFVSPGSRAATGDIENGVIKNVTTLKSGDGLHPGEYRVTIVSLDQSDKHKNDMAPPSLIPRKYADIATSELSAVIEQGSSNKKLTFNLE